MDMTPIAVAVIAAIGGAITAGISGLLQRPMRKQVAETHEQTVNSHAGQPNLREDIDSLAASLREALEILRRVPALEIHLTDHITLSSKIVRELKAQIRAAERHRAEARRWHAELKDLAAQRGFEVPEWRDDEEERP